MKTDPAAFDFDLLPIACWQEDWRSVKLKLETLDYPAGFMEDRLRSNPDQLRNLRELVTIGAINTQAAQVFGTDHPEQLRARLRAVGLHGDFLSAFVTALETQGGEAGRFQTELEVALAGGITKRFQLTWSFAPPPNQGQVVTSLVEIAARYPDEQWQYRLLFQNMLSAFSLHRVITNADGEPIDFTFEEVNRRWEEMFGLSRDAYLGHTILEMNPSFDRGQVRQFGLVGLTGEPVELTFYSAPFDRHIESRTFWVREGWFATIANDVTEKKRLEELQENTSTMFYGLIDALDEIIWIRSAPDFSLSYLNPAYDRVIGSSRAERLKDGDILSGVVLADDLNRVMEAFGGFMNGTGESDRIDFRIRRPDGEIRWLWARTMRILDEHGALIHLAGIIGDFTDLNLAKAELEQKNRELQLTNEDLDSFGYIASHDLKEPLRGIGNCARFLLEDYGEKLGEEGRAMLELLARQATRSIEQLSAMLTYSRIGREGLKIVAVEVGDILQMVQDDLAVLFKDAQASLVVETEMPPIRGDKYLIKQVYQNLISNAVKYNDKSEKTVYVGFQSSPEGPIAYVRDNGIGVAKRDIPAIFRIFKRLHAGSAYGGGVGVGLTIVKKIVESHGGHIWVESRLGEGTTFYFHFGR